MCRGWIIFIDISELNFPLLDTRLPNGCWLTSSLYRTQGHAEFSSFVVNALIPKFVGNSLEGNPPKKILVEAKEVIGVISATNAIPNEKILSWETRISLADDEEMLMACRGHPTGPP